MLDYFDGIDPKTNPMMRDKSAQYFSSVKRSIENTLRIDITIPWSVHSTQISPDLPNWFQCPAEYVVPANLADHCFVRETVKAKLKQLRAMLSTVRTAALLQQQVPPAAPAVTGGTTPPNGANVKTKTATTSKRRLKPIRQDDDDQDAVVLMG